MPIEFRIGDYLQPGKLLKLQRALRRTERMAPEELRAYQDARLRRVFEAARDVPHYRAVFTQLGLEASDLQTTADLERLPLLSKDVLRASPLTLLSECAQRHRPRWNATSGTTGRPLRFVLDRNADILEFCYYWRHWSWAGYRLGDRFAELGSVHFLTRASPHQTVQWQPVLRRLMLNSALLAPHHVGDMADALRRRKPRFLKGMPSALGHLATLLRDGGYDDLTFEAVFSSGELLTGTQRKVIESTFHTRVFDSYGHMERTVAISQCERGGYHANTDYGFLELRDERFSADGVRLARVVGTSLYNLAMPLLRYEVGDDVEVFEDARTCSCGRTLPLIKAVRGRSQDTIRTPDGRFLTSLFVIFDLVDGLDSAQIQQVSATDFLVLVVPSTSWTEAEADKLRSLAENLLGPDARVKMRSVTRDDLMRDASGKRRPVIGLGCTLP